MAGGAAIVVAGGAALSALLGGGSSAPKAKAVPAARALEALAADEDCVLIDIRSKAEIKATGGPNLKGVSKRGAVSVPYVIVVQVCRACWFKCWSGRWSLPGWSAAGTNERTCASSLCTGGSLAEKLCHRACWAGQAVVPAAAWAVGRGPVKDAGPARPMQRWPGTLRRQHGRGAFAPARCCSAVSLHRHQKHILVSSCTCLQGEEVVDEEFGAKVAKVKGVGAEGGPVILLDRWAVARVGGGQAPCCVGGCCTPQMRTGS